MLALPTEKMTLVLWSRMADDREFCSTSGAPVVTCFDHLSPAKS
jgi:hypothetical protein